MENDDLKLKWCPRCKEDKPISNFNKNNSKTGKLSSYCRLCCKAYYEENKARCIELAINKRREYNRERMFFALKFLKEKGCKDCGNRDPIVLEFDHVKGKKSGNISRMIQSGYSMQKIKDEIDKCEVRCANCHKRRTALTHNYYKDIDLDKL